MYEEETNPLYKSKKTWKEIAKNLGVSSQTVINIHNKAKRILKTKLKSENTLDLV